MSSDHPDFAELLSMIYSSLEESNGLKTAFNIYKSWNQILTTLSVKNPACKNLIGHTKIIDCKNGMLLIEVDHPGWIQILQMQQKSILNEINKKFEKKTITGIVFKLKGENYMLANVKEKKTKSNIEENEYITDEMVARKLEELKQKFKENDENSSNRI